MNFTSRGGPNRLKIVEKHEKKADRSAGLRPTMRNNLSGAVYRPYKKIKYVQDFVWSMKL